MAISNIVLCGKAINETPMCVACGCGNIFTAQVMVVVATSAEVDASGAGDRCVRGACARRRWMRRQ